MLAFFGSRTTNPGAIISIGVFLLRMFPIALAWRPTRLHVATRVLRRASAAASQEPTSRAAEASSSSRATFLENDGEWVGASSTSGTSGLSIDIGSLEALSVPELRQQAQQAGQRSTGPKKELIKRLLNQEPSGEGC